MSNLKESKNVSCTLQQSREGKTLCPNANVQNNSQEKYARYYIAFIWLHIIEYISDIRAFLSCTFKDSYNFIYEDVFTPAYLLEYPIQVSL